MIPLECRYNENHSWVRIESGLAVAGITDHAQKALMDGAAYRAFLESELQPA